jgi:hypothetical protein
MKKAAQLCVNLCVKSSETIIQDVHCMALAIANGLSSLGD